MKGRYLFIVLSAVILLSGCLKDEEFYDANKIFQEDVVEIQNYLDANGIDAELDSGSGIFFDIHDKKDGYLPARGGKVQVLYEAFTLEGTWVGRATPDNPLEYNLGNAVENLMTVGFDYGVSKTGVGDSVTIYVPSVFGYRDIGYALVPPNAILKYNIRFVEIDRLESDLESIDQYIADKNMNAEIDPDFGTRYVIHRTGTGDTPESGNRVEIDYVGELLDGTEFDESYSRSSFTFTMGADQVIIGFDLGIGNLHRGDSATFFIPSTYGYQDREQEKIPANSVLVFGVEILSITQ